jgi:hypothetical protein
MSFPLSPFRLHGNSRLIKYFISTKNKYFEIHFYCRGPLFYLTHIVGHSLSASLDESAAQSLLGFQMSKVSHQSQFRSHWSIACFFMICVPNTGSKRSVVVIQTEVYWCACYQHEYKTMCDWCPMFWESLMVSFARVGKPNCEFSGHFNTSPPR